MATLSPQTVARLKSQLLTSGLQQKDQPLFQVINLLIDSLSGLAIEVNTFTGGGGGGGGAPASGDYLTHENNQASLPSSRQVIPGAGVNIHKGPLHLMIGASPMPSLDGRDEPELPMIIPGPPGIAGPPGIMGPPGMDAAECCADAFGGILPPSAYGQLLTYTPVWTAAGVAPVINDGTLSGWYLKYGKFVFVYVAMVAGPATTFGTGAWRFSLPPIDAISPATIFHTLTGICNDVGVQLYGLLGPIDSTTTILPLTSSGNAFVTNAVPFAWGNGDALVLSGIYLAGAS